MAPIAIVALLAGGIVRDILSLTAAGPLLVFAGSVAFPIQAARLRWPTVLPAIADREPS